MSLIDGVKEGTVTVGGLVKGKRAKFSHYRQGSLMYVTDDGFEFPDPIEDIGESTFFSDHQAMELMRWIRKQVDVIKAS